jgi:hypothetical protein
MVAQVMRVSILGALPSGEEWSVNPVYSIGGDFGSTVTAAQAATIATAIAAIVVPTGITQTMSSAVTVTGARVEARTLAGDLESQGEAFKAIPTPGLGSSPHPFQVSCVSSLRTARAGASGRGRLYWPTLGMTLATSTARPTAATVTSFMSGVKTYLSAIESAIEVTLTGVALCVWSRKLQQVNVVTQIQVGDVLDVQRRRRDQLIEAIQTTPYP